MTLIDAFVYKQVGNVLSVIYSGKLFMQMKCYLECVRIFLKTKNGGFAHGNDVICYCCRRGIPFKDTIFIRYDEHFLEGLG
jgi:hypothetical protein